MFKRVEKRRKRKEEEEELGLDDATREVLGMQDTDSDESDSDSNSEPSSSVREVGEDDENDGEESEEGNDENVEDANAKPPTTVQEVLRDPIYIVSLQPEIKACVVCPGKILKGGKMDMVHRKSGGHERHVRQFTALAKGCDLNSNAWDILRRKSEEQKTLPLTSEAKSKRAEKRMALKAKRDAQKVRIKARKAARAAARSTELVSKTEEPSKKKRKLEKTTTEQDPDKKASLASPGKAIAPKGLPRSLPERKKKKSAPESKS